MQVGGTDVPPYPKERGGAVLSTTVDKYAYASLRPRDDDAIEVRSLDSACNPYLAFAAMLAAGLDGIRRNLTAPDANEENSYLLESHKRARLMRIPSPCIWVMRGRGRAWQNSWLLQRSCSGTLLFCAC